MDPSDLSGLDFESAKDYVRHFAIAVNRTRQEAAKTRTELAAWKERLRLARNQDRSDLLAQAQIYVQDLAAKLSSLEEEERIMSAELGSLKRQLNELKLRPTTSIDPDFLLAQLEELAGKPDTLAAKFRDTEADMALEELKRKMQAHDTDTGNQGTSE